MTEKPDVTVVILTFNERQHIRRCIESVRDFAREIVVVDSFSTDETIDIARELGARILTNRWVNHATQMQWALDNAGIRTEWIFRLDADEHAAHGLGQQLANALPQLPASVTGLCVRRRYVFLGRWIRHGAMYPLHVLRIWRNGAGRIEQRWMDEHAVLSRGEARHLDGDITDENLNPIGWWVAKHNGYATREAIELLNLRHGFLARDDQLLHGGGNVQATRKRKIKEGVYARSPLFVRPILYFFYRYFVRLGFLDGAEGFAFHFMQGLWYRALVDLKIVEARQWIRNCTSPEEIKSVLIQKTGLAL